ncbi:MAG TPA: PilZ domain-containing protein [Thermodesulfobium narugense]|nr:PilZ domain-containing protein [Thermodesulfobium narugense]
MTFEIIMCDILNLILQQFLTYFKLIIKLLTMDRRRYVRYRISLKGKVATQSGYHFPVEILDISVEGARFKTEQDIPINKEDTIYLLMKWNYPIKAESEIKWIKREKFHTQFGVQFVKISNEDREIFTSNIADLALSNISDIYFR